MTTSANEASIDYGILKFKLAAEFSDKSDSKMRDAIRALKELLLERQQQRATIKHKRIVARKLGT